MDSQQSIATQFTEIDSVEAFIQKALDYMKDFAQNGDFGYSFLTITLFSLLVVTVLFFMHGKIGNKIVSKLMDVVLVYFSLVLFFAYIAGAMYHGATTFAQYKLGGWAGFIGVIAYWLTFQILLKIKAVMLARADKKRAMKRFRNMQERETNF